MLASRYPLVILSHASDDRCGSNVEKLGAPFHAVYTAPQAQAYKPRLHAFEHMMSTHGDPGSSGC
jgi:2-haloacid dehalogenase